jgi:hypothetical protein
MSTTLTAQTTAEKIAAAEHLITNEFAATTDRFQHEETVLLDTGCHFAEMNEYRDCIASERRLNLNSLQPALTIAQQTSQFGIVNQTDSTRFCNLRKVLPSFPRLCVRRLVHRSALRVSQVPRWPQRDQRLPAFPHSNYPQTDPAHRVASETIRVPAAGWPEARVRYSRSFFLAVAADEPGTPLWTTPSDS